MPSNHRLSAGAVGAFAAAGTFVFGFALFATVLADYATGDLAPSESAAFVADHQMALYAWHLVILVVFGIVLVPLVLALHERLSPGAPALIRVATVFGLIWVGLVLAAGMIAMIGVGTVADLHDADPASAAPVWSTLDSVQNGLGGGNEIVGGLWVLLVSVAALRSRIFPRALNGLGVLAGVAGIVTTVPALEALGAVFGLGLIVWFVWLGFVLMSEAGTRDAAPARNQQRPALV